MVAPTRSAGLLDHVDYRLAETAGEKDEIYRLRYRAYLREGAILPSESQRVSDSYDDAPNAWIFGVYLQGNFAVPFVSAWRRRNGGCRPRLSCSATCFTRNSTRAGSSSTPPGSWPIPRRPSVSGASLCHGQAGLCRVRSLQRRCRAGDGPSRTSGILSQAVSAGKLGRAAPAGRTSQAGRIDGRTLSRVRDKVFARYPYLRSSAFERRMLFQRRHERHLTPADVVASSERASIVPQS